MDSINPQINEIHRAYCEATAFEIPLMACFERQWFEAIQNGLTADDVRLVVKDRMRRIRDGVRHQECLLIRNFIQTEEAVGEVLCEAAAIRARMRGKHFCPGKAEVLRATGRSDKPEDGPVLPIGEVIKAMRIAAG